MPACEGCGVRNAAADCLCKGTKVEEWTPLVIAALRVRFGDKTDQLITLLQESGSLISGGSVLSACLGEEIVGQDTDIYVPVAQIPRFLNSMVMTVGLDGVTPNEPIFPATHYKKYAASFYCSSFLRKNGIRKVYNFGGPNPLVVVYGKPKLPEVDIMSVRNARGPLAVVNNFDLTFCQVWFDGRDVYASDPDHIRTKSGILQKDYCLTLLGGNRFLKRRIRKYMDRGFNIRLDDSVSSEGLFGEVMTKIGQIQNPSYCSTPVDGLRDSENKYNDIDSEFVQKWYNRIAMRYFLGKRDGDDLATNNRFLVIPLKSEVHNNQIKRMDKDAELHNRGLTYLYNFGDHRAGLLKAIEDFKIAEDDGYDSDDMDEDALKKLALRRFGADATDLHYYKECTKLVLNAQVDQGDGETTLGSLARSRYRGYNKRKAKQLLDIIETKALRTGEDLFGNDGKLYDIHEHDLRAATTREGLEAYLGSTMTSDDYEPKCYNSADGCTKRHTTAEIKAIVSAEFYEIFSAPRPVKSGLNREVDNFETVFRNSKSLDKAWGNIYHITMCPFCLKFEERGHGCAYMTHDNPNGFGPSKAPYCKVGRPVLEIVNKYKTAGRGFGDGYSHLEFCVECGRPCSGHAHFNLDMTGMVDNQMIPDPRHQGQMMYDYGNCPGGGRPELIARMMAVRDVYRRRDLKDVTEERRVAAVAADAAPLNPELMRRANALWAIARPGIEWNERREAAAAAAKAAAAAAGRSEIEQRDAALAAVDTFRAANPAPSLVEWNVAVPKTKAYNDPLYADVENDPDYDGWLGEPEEVATAYNAAMPDVPANAAQAEWNHAYLDRLKAEHIRPLTKADKEEYLQMLIEIADAEIKPIGEIDQININIVNALLLLSVYQLPVNKLFEGFIIKGLAKAIILGGDRIKNGMDPDIDTHLAVYVNRLASLKDSIKDEVNRLLTAPAPAPAPAPAANALEAAALAHFEAGLEGGKRKTYKRRTGIPKKKTRTTRRN